MSHYASINIVPARVDVLFDVLRDMGCRFERKENGIRIRFAWGPDWFYDNNGELYYYADGPAGSVFREYTYRVALEEMKNKGYSLVSQQERNGRRIWTFADLSGTGTVTVTVLPSSKVKVEVSGIPGEGCLSVTKDLESALGVVQERELTADYHRPADPVRVFYGSSWCG
ncbi:hypothetical protein Desku_0765 [Desulfofundulus kuznetsovii DSM 6115]|uniref:Uncharacterized protein n=2 Tax=Desulfofundulus kuznetsovii TaxID=58135 RepID=A0AAU8P9A3_DESK7|nr:hypothetical protein Desku_0765 [Desulfofundulus kuznetsovii DSM 6115]